MKAVNAVKAMKETKAMKPVKAAQSVKSMKKVDDDVDAKQPPPTDEQLDCLHDLRTRAGSNAFIVQQKCEICMFVIPKAVALDLSVCSGVEGKMGRGRQEP